MILENCRNRNTNLSIAWIDYKKGFDSLPHSWIEKCLETFKISPVLRNFLSHNMCMWKTTLVLNTVENTLNAGDININSGIFQGDSLAPILFCVTLIPLTTLLNNTGYIYKIYDNTIIRLLYMDDLKLFAKNDQQLQGLLNIVKQFSDDIRMEFGLDKCAKATFFCGKLLKAKNITLDTTMIIKDLEPEESYKYLGVGEVDGMQHSSMRKKFGRYVFYLAIYAIYDTTPYVCSKNIEFVFAKLEENSNIAIKWFENNYMKMNSDKCHLFVSGHKYEHLWAKIGNDKIWETRTVKLLDITIGNELKFDEHFSNVCLKANMKLPALMKIR